MVPPALTVNMDNAHRNEHDYLPLAKVQPATVVNGQSSNGDVERLAVRGQPSPPPVVCNGAPVDAAAEAAARRPTNGVVARGRPPPAKRARPATSPLQQRVLLLNSTMQHPAHLPPGTRLVSRLDAHTHNFITQPTVFNSSVAGRKDAPPFSYYTVAAPLAARRGCRGAGGRGRAQRGARAAAACGRQQPQQPPSAYPAASARGSHVRFGVPDGVVRSRGRGAPTTNRSDALGVMSMSPPYCRLPPPSRSVSGAPATHAALPRTDSVMRYRQPLTVDTSHNSFAARRSLSNSPAASRLGVASSPALTPKRSHVTNVYTRSPSTSSKSTPVELRQARLEERSLDMLVKLRSLENAQAQYHVNHELQKFVGRLLDNSTVDAVAAARKASGAAARKQPSLENRIVRLLRGGLADVASPSSPSAPDGRLCVASAGVSADDALERTAAALSTHLRRVQTHVDADATDSSSGGDSDDDAVSPPRRKRIRHSSSTSRPTAHSSAAIERRAWKWHSSRAWLGSRWGWLQSHVADLEYKIRQQMDICRQVRARKPTLVQPSDATGRSGAAESALSLTCARVRPLRLMQNRKLVRTTGMYRWNRKTARLSTVGCGCAPPWQPCVLCSGRLNNTDSSPNACAQTAKERAALLDAAFNPVLSDWRDVRADRLLQVALKQRASANRLTPKKGAKKAGKAQATSQSAGVNGRPPVAKGALALHARGRPPIGQKRATTLKIVAAAKAKQKAVSKQKAGRRKSSGSSRPLTPSSDAASGRASPAKPAGKLSGLGRRPTVQPTYDFDNIVIDPSVLAVSRVEKLQYKEIATPGWRTADVQPSVGADDEEEDLSDEAFELRHSSMERTERGRFQAYKACVWTMGRRASESAVRPLIASTPPPTPPRPPSPVAPPPPSRAASPFPARTFPLSDLDAV